MSTLCFLPHLMPAAHQIAVFYQSNNPSNRTATLIDRLEIPAFNISFRSFFFLQVSPISLSNLVLTAWNSNLNLAMEICVD